MMCFGFALGYLLVLNFIERPILPLIGEPSEIGVYEQDIRGVHALLRALQGYSGTKVFLPIGALALITSGWQAYFRDFDFVSLAVLLNVLGLTYLATFRLIPESMRLKRIESYFEDLDDVSNSLFRVARLHQSLLIAIVPLTLAQTTLLFL